MYKLKDYHEKPIKRLFYSSELQYIDKDKDALFYIQKILKTRKRNGNKEHYVKFIGWNNSYNQWILGNDIIDTKTTNITA